MKTPINQLLDKIEYKKINYDEIPDGLYQTHFGILKIGEFEIDVAVLSDGRRIITEESMKKIFGDDFEKEFKDLLNKLGNQ